MSFDERVYLKRQMTYFTPDISPDEERNIRSRIRVVIERRKDIALYERDHLPRTVPREVIVYPNPSYL